MHRAPIATLRGSALIGADVATLWWSRPDVPLLLNLGRHPGATLARSDADAVIAVVAATMLWVVAAWVALALLAVSGARLPGLAGRVCASAARVVVPAVARRVLLGALGVGVGVGLVAGPAMASAAASPGAAPARPAAVFGVCATAPGTAGFEAAPAHERLPAPPWPGSPHQRAHHQHPSTARDQSADRARVHSGDSLWLLAARRLGPNATPARTAAYWPRVYAANRQVIGSDPGLISPGQVLRLPPPGS